MLASGRSTNFLTESPEHLPDRVHLIYSIKMTLRLALVATVSLLFADQAIPEGEVLPPAAPAIVVHSFGVGRRRNEKDHKAVTLGALEIRRLLTQLVGPDRAVSVLMHQEAASNEAVGTVVDLALAGSGSQQHVFVTTADQ